MLFVRHCASVLILQKEPLAQSQAGAFKAYLHKVQMSLCVKTYHRCTLLGKQANPGSLFPFHTAAWAVLFAAGLIFITCSCLWKTFLVLWYAVYYFRFKCGNKSWNTTTEQKEQNEIILVSSIQRCRSNVYVHYNLSYCMSVSSITYIFLLQKCFCF